MRTIDADALVAQWEVEAEQAEDVIAKMFIYVAIHDVKHAPTIETEPQWIPCSERLPEEKGEYIVAYHPCYWDDVEAEVKVGVDSFRGKTSWAKQKYQRVIAWMPLPTPYRDDGTEGR